MSDGANQRFTQHPRTFMGSNLVVTEMQDDAGVWRTPGQYIANLDIHPHHKASLPDGTPVPVFRVSLATGRAWRVFGRSYRFRSHYLAFRDNTEQHMTLDNTADFFFTDTLNGCCFVSGGGRNPTVSHINYTVGRVAGSAIDDPAIDAEILNIYGHMPARTLKKNDYKNSVGAYVTVVGIRNRVNDHWRFYWQRYEWAPPPIGIVITSPTGKHYEFQDARVRV